MNKEEINEIKEAASCLVAFFLATTGLILLALLVS